MRNLTGQRFGRLVAIESIEKRAKQGSIIWLCKCECGAFIEVPEQRLASGGTKSCGCLHREGVVKRNYRHGERQTKLYTVWHNIKARCSNLRRPDYKYYGGRGIRVCDEWKNDFIFFRNFALANGYKEGLSIDRIDNDGDYEPLNVQFITLSENIAKANKLRGTRI